MDVGTGRQTRDRYDRHVRRTRLCVDAHAPAHLLAFTIEEALRLASLPGENEGRSYYFRRLRVTGLPSGGDRRVWLEKFQRALYAEAAQAIHGADARAASAPAVFFRGEQEALEILLHRMLARRAIHEWFWPMVAAGTRAHASEAASIPDIVEIVEKLRSGPASWVAVAAALFSLPGFDVGALLEAIPQAVAEGWLREMPGGMRGETARPQLRAPAMARIPSVAMPAVRQAVRRFGFRDPRTLWLATLAVLFDSPSDLAAGTAVWRAQSALQRLIAEGVAEAEGEAEPRAFEVQTQGRASVADTPAVRALRPLDSPELLRGESVNGSDGPAASGSLPVPTQAPPVAMAARPIPAAPALPPAPSAAFVDGPALSTSSISSPAPTSTPSPAPAGADAWPTAPVAIEPSPSTRAAHPASIRWNCSGLPTDAAGFFFLLNALQRIGITQALASGLAAAGPNFVARLLQRLAEHSGVGPDDPIWLWLISLPTSEDGGDALACDASCWPSNLRSSRDTAPADYVVRIWYLAVRRWCRRIARISVRDIVTRPGVFSVNRTDLDVSLPLEEADIRVRRAGLDLDPGWVPWFGRVVRFHYLFRGEFHA